VISGFIMWTVASNAAPLPFLANRIKRIAPLYWLVTLAVVVAAFMGASPRMRDEMGIGHVAQSLAFWPHFSPGTKEIWPVLVPGWTLNYEMFFYVVFAACLTIPRSLRVAMMTVIMLVLVELGAVTDPTGAWLITYTSPLMLEFIAGLWIAVAVQREMALPPGLGWFATATGLGGLLILPYREGDALEVTCCIVFATFAIAGIASLDARGLVPKWRAAEFAGNASYSIYLWNGIAVSLAGAVGHLIGLPLFAIVIVAVLGGLAIGSLSYLLIEKPIRQRMSRKPAVAS
jgi:exopolysaccharide production protein ExoZ